MSGYGWSFPAGDEVRVGIGSFDPRDHVKEPTVRLAARPRTPARRLPGQLDPPRAAPGRRGRRVLRRRLGGPLPAALGRGHPHRPLLRPRGGPRAPARPRRAARRASGRSSAMARSAPSTAGSSRRCSRTQDAYRHVPPRVMAGIARAFGHRDLSRWAFQRYLEIAPPSYALAGPAARGPRRAVVGRGLTLSRAARSTAPARWRAARRRARAPLSRTPAYGRRRRSASSRRHAADRR